MATDLAPALDAILERAVSREPRVPGVVAMVTDRDGVLYEGSAGVRRLGDPAPMTTDSVVALFSLTKAITGTAVLRFVEEGRLDLDAPAKRYCPEIGALEVLDGFDDAGAPLLRAPKRDVTTRMLMLHTAGFGYSFLNASLSRLAERGQPNPRLGLKAGLMTPLLFDPGDAWEYGVGIDWAGQVVEAVAGQRLDAVLQRFVFDPLRMSDTRFVPTSSMRSRRASMHQRGPDGTLTPIAFERPEAPEVWMGGTALFGTVPDYIRFLRMWLNDGMGEAARVLKAETIADAVRNHLSGVPVRRMTSVSPSETHDVEFFPGVAKGWGLTFMVNEAEAPTGRPAGAFGWAGLGNLYYWADRRNGLAGVLASQVFPFMDPAAIEAFLAFETAVYDAVESRA
jgi:methyl acetate hydrolase